MTVMPALDIETLVLEDMDIPLPCDYSESLICPDQPAAWVLYPVPCCSAARVRLACDSCKTWRLESPLGVVCESCDEYTVPARRAYQRIEAL